MIEAEIPQNTGNMGRTCVGACSELHLVGNLSFRITDRNLKRAGLDYWPNLSWYHHRTFSDWMNQVADPKRIFFFETKGTKSYFEVKYQPGDWLVFGKETTGLDDSILRAHPDQVVKIPTLGPIRSLNVATAAAMAVFEGVRQLSIDGKLERYPGF
jgi:tRNA (cytidine/uridine-2'-O-)-methyltransferase